MRRFLVCVAAFSLAGCGSLLGLEDPQAAPGGVPDGAVDSNDGTPEPGASGFVHHWASEDLDHAKAVAVDADGNVTVVGSFGGRVATFPADSTAGAGRDAFVIRLDPIGAVSWIRTFGGTGVDEASTVVATSDGGVLVGGVFSGDISVDGQQLPQVDAASAADTDVFVIALDRNGRATRVRSYGGAANDGIGQLATDSDGLIAAIGSFHASATFGGREIKSEPPEKADLWVATFAPDGTHLWSGRFGGADDDQPGGIRTAAGAVFFTGAVQGPVTIGDAPPALGSWDVLVAGLTALDGAVLWAQRFGGAGDDRGYGLAFTGGAPVIALNFRSTELMIGTSRLSSRGLADFAVAHLHPSTGAPTWTRHFGGSGDDVAYHLASMPSGNLLVGGYFTGDIDLGGGTRTPVNGDAYALELDDDGLYVGMMTFGSNQGDATFGTAAAPDGQAVIGGFYSAALSVGGTVIGHGSGTDRDILVVKTALRAPCLACAAAR